MAEEKDTLKVEGIGPGKHVVPLHDGRTVTCWVGDEAVASARAFAARHGMADALEHKFFRLDDGTPVVAYVQPSDKRWYLADLLHDGPDHDPAACGCPQARLVEYSVLEDDDGFAQVTRRIGMATTWPPETTRACVVLWWHMPDHKAIAERVFVPFNKLVGGVKDSDGQEWVPRAVEG